MGGRILLVDDEPAAGFLIKQIFRSEIRAGIYALESVNDGHEALAILEDRAFDVVLCDIHMPKMDGLTLLSHIHHLYPNLKVIMVSAYSDMEKIRRSMNYGAYDFIRKPIDAKDLKVTVENAFEALRKERERDL